MSDISQGAASSSSDNGNDNNNNNVENEDDESDEQVTPPLSQTQAMIMANEKSKYSKRERRDEYSKIPLEGDIISIKWVRRRKALSARIIESFYNGDVTMQYIDEKGRYDKMNIFADSSRMDFSIIESVYCNENVNFIPIPPVGNVIKMYWKDNMGWDTCKVVRHDAIMDPHFESGGKENEYKENEQKKIDHFAV